MFIPRRAGWCRCNCQPAVSLRSRLNAGSLFVDSISRSGGGSYIGPITILLCILTFPIGLLYVGVGGAAWRRRQHLVTVARHETRYHPCCPDLLRPARYRPAGFCAVPVTRSRLSSTTRAPSRQSDARRLCHSVHQARGDHLDTGVSCAAR